MVNKEILNLAVVIIPSEEVIARAVELSGQIKSRFASYVVLHPERSLPHISLYQLALPADSFTVACGRIALAAEKKPIELATGIFELYLGRNIFWRVNNSMGISNLQGALIGGLNPLRQGYLIDRHAKSLAHNTDIDIGAKRRLAIAETGDPLTRTQFQPHITLGAIPNPQDAVRALELLSSPPMAFTADQVCLVRLGRYGICREILQRFKLEEVDIWEGNPPNVVVQSKPKAET